MSVTESEPDDGVLLYFVTPPVPLGPAGLVWSAPTCIWHFTHCHTSLLLRKPAFY